MEEGWLNTRKEKREARKKRKEGRRVGNEGWKRDDGVNSTLYRRPPSLLSPCNPLEEFKFTLAFSPQHLFFYTPFNRSGSTT